MAEVLRNDNLLNQLRTELDKLTDEHCALKTKLTGFDDRLYLTSDQQIERKNLQKLKLRAKDRIAQIARRLAQ